MAGKSYLVIRADANTRIGTGHLMRCLALAQAWRDSGGEVVFITACESPVLLQRLSDESFEAIQLDSPYPDPADLEATSQVLAAHPNAWAVLDGYHFDEAYQKQVKEASHRLLVIDDMAHLEHYYADIVLNQNLHAGQLNYPCEPYTQLLLGTRYVLLRREFLQWQNWKREIPQVARKVLVTLGGADLNNVTLKVIKAIHKLNVRDLEVKVVVGPSNPHIASLKEAVDHSLFAIHLLPSVESMPELMAWADVAVSAGGSTCWELAFMGLPAVILVVADNQRNIAEQLASMKVAVNLGWHENLSPVEITKAITRLLIEPQVRAEMAQRSQHLVDGESGARVLMCLKDERLRLRQASEDDCRLFWEWANDPEVRAAAFSSDHIAWEVHEQWFARKLYEPNCFLFVAVDDQDTPAGQVRFDVDEEREAEIDVSIDRVKRRLGYGSLLISMGVAELFRITPMRTVHALIKLHNKASIRAFEEAGFKKLAIETIRGNVTVHYIRNRSDEE